jgi:hypothetical protein
MNGINFKKKALNKLLFIFLVINCSSCNLFYWDGHDMEYHVYLQNDSKDTLTVAIGDGNKYVFDSVNNFTPDSKLHLQLIGIKYDRTITGKVKETNIDVIRDELFVGTQISLVSGVRVYRNDSLLINWEGPLREMGADTHHFYNYSSWECYETSKWEGVVLFTIKDSDFK